MARWLPPRPITAPPSPAAAPEQLPHALARDCTHPSRAAFLPAGTWALGGSTTSSLRTWACTATSRCCSRWGPGLGWAGRAGQHGEQSRAWAVGFRGWAAGCWIRGRLGSCVCPRANQPAAPAPLYSTPQLSATLQHPAGQLHPCRPAPRQHPRAAGGATGAAARRPARRAALPAPRRAQAAAPGEGLQAGAGAEWTTAPRGRAGASQEQGTANGVSPVALQHLRAHPPGAAGRGHDCQADAGGPAQPRGLLQGGGA